MGTDTVAIFNTNDDLVELLRVALERAGFITISLHLDDVRRGRASLHDFIEEHQPKVIIYDIAAPYDQSWRYLERLRAAPFMADRHIVLTSPNVAKALEGVDRPERVFEIVGKPYDIDALVDVVRQSARARPVH
jgi:DNA-binding NarL/FixJ family response regulator